MSPWTDRLTKYIAWTFYAIFFFVPLIMWPTTFELFEFNKMWFVFGMALLILLFWGSKMLIQGKVYIRRTPLDIPLLLFTLSQIISTIWSLDPHVSFWGYYSRFNGGLLSTLTYIFLYYAFASNLVRNPNEHSYERGKKTFSYKILIVSFLSGVAVCLWGLPSHFGYDPTCWVFRGTFDVSCWTESFHPTIRMFSTLGQPDWMSAYLAVIIPIAIAFSFTQDGSGQNSSKKISFNISALLINWKFWMFSGIGVLMYLCFLWTRSQSGFIGFWAGFIVMILFSLFYELNNVKLSGLLRSKFVVIITILLIVFGIVTSVSGSGLGKLDAVRDRILSLLHSQQVAPQPTPSAKSSQSASPPPVPAGELGGTDSLKIRFYVWQGAIKLFEEHPLFGTGVETFGFSYYSVRPIGHNLTSEWDYLYNKAHNEYLNYAATTGGFGLGTYLAFILLFLFLASKTFIGGKPIQTANSIKQNMDSQQKGTYIVGAALVGGFVSILVSNFFGFSVVIVNLYLFLIPLFFFDEFGMLQNKYFFAKAPEAPQFPNQKKNLFGKQANDDIGAGRIISIVILIAIVLYCEFLLFRSWQADIKYALGNNLDHVSEYIQANPVLAQAVDLRPGEDVFQDEYAVNLATLALIAAEQKQTQQAAQFADQAKQIADGVIARHPNNILFWKDRTRIYYALAQLNSSVMSESLAAIDHARQLAPTDAKILYNEALIYQQMGNMDKAAELLKKSGELKPNYGDAYYSLGLLYTNLAKDEKNRIKKQQDEENAREALEYFQKNLDPNNTKVNELLKNL